jgi:hypothetical protein
MASIGEITAVSPTGLKATEARPHHGRQFFRALPRFRRVNCLQNRFPAQSGIGNGRSKQEQAIA